MKCVVLGLRLKQLGGYKATTFHNQIKNEMRRTIQDYPDPWGAAIELLYTGMSPGVGIWAAEIAVELNLPFIAAIPFENHYKVWTQNEQRKYHKLLKNAAEVVHVDRQPNFISRDVPPGVFDSRKPTRCNIWMRDQLESGDLIIAVHAPRQSNRVISSINRYYTQDREITLTEIDITQFPNSPEMQDDIPF